MNARQAVALKWSHVPKTHRSAKAALARPPCSACVVCNSRWVLPIIRPPAKDWKIHCNHCGAEVGFHVVINRNAWRTVANWSNRQNYKVRLRCRTKQKNPRQIRAWKPSNMVIKATGVRICDNEGCTAPATVAFTQGDAVWLACGDCTPAGVETVKLEQARARRDNQ